MITLKNFEEREIHLNVLSQQTHTIEFKKEKKIAEVVITAKEVKGLTSKSVIDRQSMQHLQPSSFADLMELLPVGLSRDPNLSVSNRIVLRENTDGPSSYWLIKMIIRFLSFGIKKKAKKKEVHFTFLFMKANGKQLAEITKLIESGIIKPVIDKVFPLEDTNKALEYVESGRAKGKVVVKLK